MPNDDVLERQTKIKQLSDEYHGAYNIPSEELEAYNYVRFKVKSGYRLLPAELLAGESLAVYLRKKKAKEQH